jgi:hypothetical protein
MVFKFSRLSSAQQVAAKRAAAKPAAAQRGVAVSQIAVATSGEIQFYFGNS